jgi:hypothetical protein
MGLDRQMSIPRAFPPQFAEFSDTGSRKSGLCLLAGVVCGASGLLRELAAILQW